MIDPRKLSVDDLVSAMDMIIGNLDGNGMIRISEARVWEALKDRIEEMKGWEQPCQGVTLKSLGSSLSSHS